METQQRYKIEIKGNRQHLFTFKELYGFKYTYNLRLNTYRFHTYECTKIIGEHDADFYIWIDGRWFLFDHTTSLNSRYNKMLIEAQKKGFNNVFELVYSKGGMYHD